MGSSSDTPYSGSGTPTSVYSILNASYSGLSTADGALVSLSDSAVPASMPAESSLTAAQAQQIAADFTDQSINGTAPSSSAYAAYLSTHDPSYAQQAPAIGSAGTTWSQLSGLIGNLGSVPSVLNSSDTATITSSGTVTQANSPIDYNVTLSAPAGGYVLPSAFTLTFPAGLAVNTALVGAEINAAANGTSAGAIAAIEANPSGTAIGTVTLTSPLADAYGGSNNQLVGKVYVVQTGATSGQGSVTQPYLELWFAPYIYNLGSFPSSLAFPLTLQFGLAATPLGPEPLPISSLAMSFPAATSPVKATTCTSLGTVSGTATDEVANLALLFGDVNDGLTSLTGTPTAVNLSASPTTVTDQCAAVAKPPKSTATGSASGLTSGSPTVTIKVKAATAFSSETIGLPSGLKFVKSSSLAKEVSVSGAKVKSVKIAGGKLVITLKSKAKSDTVKTKKGLISESSALVKSIKKHKTKKLTVTVHAGSASVKASVNA